MILQYSSTIKNYRRMTWLLLFSQFVLAGLAAVVTLLIVGEKAAMSTLLGGLVCVVANSFYAYRIWGCFMTPNVGKQTLSLYLGEAIKLIMIAALFVLIIKWLDVKSLFVLLGVAVIQFSNFLIPVWIMLRQAKVTPG